MSVRRELKSNMMQAVQVTPTPKHTLLLAGDLGEAFLIPMPSADKHPMGS